MRFSQQFRMSVTRRGEKAMRLGTFIAGGLGRLGAAGRCAVAEHPAERSILVIARSPQSPVVKSVAALAREIADAGCILRVILAKSERVGLAETFLAVQAAGLDCEVRFVRNPRLIEVHEQLVLGERACWTGDTMRRDPAVHDAYESFVEDSAEVAATARLTFERLWMDGVPLAEPAPVAAAVLPPPKAIASLPSRQPY